jgi:hypothetical protein
VKLQVDFTRLAVVVALAAVAYGLARLGKSDGSTAAILIGIVTAANGFLRSPTQVNRRATDVIVPVNEEPPHEQP